MQYFWLIQYAFAMGPIMWKHDVIHKTGIIIIIIIIIIILFAKITHT